MTYYKKSLEFPCGFKCEIVGNAWHLIIEVDKIRETCPLHDKKCKRGKIVRC